MKREYPSIRPVGEGAILVEYEPEVCLEVNLKVRRLAFRLEQYAYCEILEVLPAYRSVMVYFDPLKVQLKTIHSLIEQVMAEASSIELPAPRFFNIPTVYGGSYGPDLERVAACTKQAPEEVIRLFSSRRYPVYCLGFLCCLIYMAGVPEVLQVPRLRSPRPYIPAGSVGFAGPQANIIPVDTPSGLNYIGRTFVPIYNPRVSPPTPIRPGDYVKCKAVSESEARLGANKVLGDFAESI